MYCPHAGPVTSTTPPGLPLSIDSLPFHIHFPNAHAERSHRFGFSQALLLDPLDLRTLFRGTCGRSNAEDSSNGDSNEWGWV